MCNIKKMGNILDSTRILCHNGYCGAKLGGKNMTMITINNFDSWQYKELWRITKMKDGCIYKTEDTKKCVRRGFKIPEGYTTSVFSTSLISKPQFEIDLIDDITEIYSTCRGITPS
jgi:hypothetical protein